MAIDILIFVATYIWTMFHNLYVIAAIPAGLLGLVVFTALMFDAYRVRIRIPVWILKPWLLVAWGWMFYFFHLAADPAFVQEYGFWWNLISEAIFTGMLTFIVPYMVGLVPAVFWMFGVIVIEFINSPDTFMGTNR